MSNRHPYASARWRQSGMALVAVLWMVAFLSIVATGLTRSIRQETRTAALAWQQAQAQALGDGAIQIALQTLTAKPQQFNQMTQADIAYGGVSMQVQVIPLNGLVDINAAGQALLEKTFVVAGGLSAQAAQAAAQAVVEARQRRDAQGRAQRFEAEEDLMQVPGIDYDLYARLAPLLTADLQGSGRVNPLAAPVEVLTVLSGGNVGAAARIAAARDAGAVGVDTSSLDGSLIDRASTRTLRLQARVPMADGTIVRVSRSVDLSARTADGAPWYTFRTSTSVESPRPKTS
ncbi:type II secretion system protein GspK [Diaphorobacter sp.]|uniref:type II secretion system protein GspK n=1 Tax=Diaphorobacter sp. TaxID=1934310 RepID=UPI002585FF55|nr:type II secretion system protein GspK [Diaphorobacter sp.]